MTCLYCGKKLGFFSRYKDTPFCSEDHLRVHQDELERALMERLGSKSSPPVRSLDALASDPPLATKSMMGLEAATRQKEPTVETAPKATAKAPHKELHKDSQKDSPKESKKAKEPAPAVAQSAEASTPAPVVTQPEAPETPPPPPQHDDYIIGLPDSRPDLNIGKPMIPAASFAIIVQSDCCTPSSPEPALYQGLPLESTEFEIDAISLLTHVAFAAPALPTAFTENEFGEDLLRLPLSTSLELDTDFAIFGDAVPLDYEASSTGARQGTLGRRDELAPRIRLRYPYAASEVSSASNGLTSTSESYTLSEASDWAPVLPSQAAPLRIEEPFDTDANLAPNLEVPLTIEALASYALEHAEPSDTRNALEVFAVALTDTPALPANCTSSSWGANTLTPRSSTAWITRSNWQPTRSSDRVPPIPFPSLFQLGSVLPPRPESAAG